MSRHNPESLKDLKNIKCLVGSVLISLGSGTVYCYSYYNSQLLENCKIPIDKISQLSLSLSIGSALLGLVVGPMIDNLGCNFMSYLGGIETFLGYFIILSNYKKRANASVTLICLALAMVGMGSICGFYSCIKCVTYNFPNSRGFAGSIPVSCYALSSLVFSTFFKYTVKNDIEKVFQIFMIACSVMICIGGSMIFMRDYESLSTKSEDIVTKSQKITEDNSLNSVLTSDNNITKPMAIKNTSKRNESFSNKLQGSLAFWGAGKIRETPDSVFENSQMSQLDTDGRRTSFNDLTGKARRESTQSNLLNSTTSSPLLMHTRVPSQNHVSKNNVNFNDNVEEFDLNMSNHESISPIDEAVAVKPTKTQIIQHSSTRGLSLYSSLTSTKFIGYYLTLALLQGIGQTYIYSVGFIVPLLFAGEDLTNVEVTPASVQSVQVSLIAICSFMGRLLSGPLSDRLVMKKTQRKWNIIIASFLLCLGSYVISHFDGHTLAAKIHYLNTCSCILAFGFGMVFGTYPALIVDAFGTELFSSLWGIVTTGGLVTVKIFSKLLSIDLDKDDCEALGNKCVLKTFSITLLLSLVAMAMTGCMIFTKFQKRKERISRYHYTNSY